MKIVQSTATGPVGLDGLFARYLAAMEARARESSIQDKSRGIPKYSARLPFKGIDLVGFDPD